MAFGGTGYVQKETKDLLLSFLVWLYVSPSQHQAIYTE